MQIDINFEGVETLSAVLYKKSRVQWTRSVMKSLTNIFNRGKTGGTPEDTRELLMSLSVSPPANFGYGGEVGYRAKDYAPHVEYGHRTVNGGYVAGQHFLQRNVEQERDAFIAYLKEQMRED